MNVKHLQKRKARRWMLLLLMLPLMAARAYAYDFSAVCSTGQTLYYNITDAVNHTVELTCPNHVEVDEEGYFISLYPWQNFQMPTGSITLPETVENNGVVYTVTSVGDFAFFYCEGLTGSLRIPNSVTAIGNYAFEYCSGFNSLTIGSSVTTIGDYAFSRCSGFTGLLTIPNSVTTIGDYAFFVCESFTGSLTIGSSVITIGDYAFSQCSGFTGSLAIPNSVTTIGNYAFEYCSGFNSLKIGSSVTTIGDYAFRGCTGFRRTLSIPGTVTTIGNYAFYECSGFSGSLTIPNSVTSIGVYAFAYCTGFTGSLTIGNSVTTIGTDAFFRCTGFTGTLTIGSSVTTIGFAAFGRCTGFTGTLTIPNSVTTIDDYAFEYCSGLTGSLTIPNSVTTLGEYAFIGCTGFDGTLTLSNSLTAIRDYTFSECSNLTGSLNIPESVNSIGNYAFYECSGFTGSLAIPESVNSIGNYAFDECSGFTGSLAIPESVNSIGNYAFYECSGFTGTLAIPNSVTTIGNSAFYNCHGFTGSLTIPNSVTTIGSAAFSNCYGFTGSLTIPNSVTTIGSAAFSNCYGFTGSLTIPNSVTTIGNSAFSNCYGFTGSLNIPNSVTTIGNSAFYYCSGFTGSLTIGNSVTTIGYQAFEYCRGFNSIISKPAAPPTAGSWCFSVSSSTPVQVPCGSTEAYRQAAQWSNFTNYSEDLLFDIIVSSSNEAFGTVAVVQDIDCDNNQATVQATPSLGYQFVNWTTDCYYFEGFEEGIPSGWAIIDADGDGEAWYVSSESGSHEIPKIVSHNGSCHLMSESYCNASGPLDPDNYLVMPRVSLPGGAVFSFWAAAQDSDFPEEHFGVAVSTGSQTNPNDFTLVEGAEWTITSGRGHSGNARGGNRASTPTEWVKYTVDLSAYAGQDCYIAIRHFNCPEQQALCIDDVELFSDEPMPVSDLATYSFVVTEDVNLTANFEPVDGYDIRVYANPVEGGTVTGAGIYGEMETVTLTATPNEDYRFVNWTETVIGSAYTTFSESFENGIPSDWAVIDADGDGHNWYHSTEAGSHNVTPGSAHSGSGFMLSESYCRANNHALNPDEYLVLPMMTIGEGCIFSFWASAHESNYSDEHFGVAISTTGNTDADDFTTINEWILTAKSERGDNPRAQGNWYQYSVDLSEYAGQDIYVAIRHFNCLDRYILYVDDVELSSVLLPTDVDVVLSTDPVYTFEATSNQQIKANFEYIGVVHVTPDGTGDGSSWDNALSDIQEAINLAESSSPTPRVWVKAGTYMVGQETNQRGDHYLQYSNENYSDNVGSHGEVWWGIKIPASQLRLYAGRNLTKVGTYTIDDYNGNYTAEVYVGDTPSASTLVSTATEYLTGNTWHDIELTTPVVIDPAQDLWLCFHTLNISYPASGCDYVGNSNSDYISTDGNTWEHAVGFGLNYTWMIRGTVDGYSSDDFLIMAEGINVYGGFAGDEPHDYDLSLRDFEANQTVLDGQNEHSVLYQLDDFTTQTLWDGFTIVNGHSDGNGGGAYLLANSKLQNCVFEQCQGGNGGAVFANGTEFVNCAFRKNTASDDGGAVYVKNGGFVNCLFANNQADNGGAVYADGAVEFINCDMVSNKAANFGAGIYSNGGIFTNCIVWGNESDNETRQVFGEGTFSYCAVEGGISGENNLVLNSQNTGNGCTYPRFENPSLTAGADDETENVSWHLMENSACINHGNNEAIAGYDMDIDGEDRIQLDAVDMGCYESPYEGVVIPDDGIVYVALDGNGDGTSWENALNDIQEAMGIAATSDPKSMVWVKAGTYPNNSGNRAMSQITAYADGTATVGTLPMYGYYADAYTRSQYVIPATEIAQMTGYPIYSLTYHTTSTPAQWTSSFQVYLKEVNYTTMNSLIAPTTATTVYTGKLTVANGKMTIVFDTPYYYNGGNLLIGMDCIEKGNYVSCNFQAAAVNGAGMYAYNYDATTFGTPRAVNYAPTTTFNFGEGEDLFMMVEGVNVYGGFAGNEPADYDLSSRDFETNETVLDGQNTQRVLRQVDDFTTQTIWDGFTIANGNNGYNYGGGAYLMTNSKLQNFVFEQCQGGNGGAVFANGTEFVNCVFRKNTAVNGGAVHVKNGGFVNCLFANNQADNGGAVYADGAVEFINCDMVSNKAANFGAGIYSNGGIFTNCIVWGNESDNETRQVFGEGTFSYCAVEGGISGENNLVLNSQNTGNGCTYPRFENPSLTAGADDETENVSWRLMENSACINHGNNEAIAGYDLDIDGEDRIQLDVVDLGCYESPYEGIVIPDDGIIYVTLDGNGDGTSWENALNDIQEAMGIAATSDPKSMVWVKAGTYAGDGSLGGHLTAYANGSTTVGTLPMYGLYADAYTRSQYVIPATEIAQMAGYPINSLTYHTTSTPSQWTSDFQVYLTEVDYTTMSSLIDPAMATTVHTGQLTVSNGKMTVVFDAPYYYNGGNLLIGMDCIEKGNYAGCNFQAEAVDGAGMFAYNSNAPTFDSPLAVNYVPTTTFSFGEGEDLLLMVEGVNVYGGFAGNEPADYDLSSRDFEMNETVLDGQNTRRVLHQTAAFTAQTIWDGFTIANGNNGYNNGGGAYLIANSKLQNCVFENNQGSYYGGAVYVYDSRVTLVNCIFRNNTASAAGGAVFAYEVSLSDCQFISNQAQRGGAVYATLPRSSGGTEIENCDFRKNVATASGGAIYTHVGRYANCLFENNQANYGGGVYVDSRFGSSEFINCNIVNNNSPYYGGGIYIYGDGSTFTNCIVWGNNSNQVYGNGNFNYCAVEGGVPGENNICLTSQNDSNGYLSPKFENPSLTAGADDETENVSWRLREGSACINKGNNEAVADYEMDFAGESRIQQDVVDLGCYESPYEGTVIPEFTDGIVYVTPEGSGDGTSWSNATNDIRKALQMASLTDPKPMVWVATGTYQGNDDDGLGDTFEFNFDSDLDGWTNIDADADGEVWYHSTQADAHSVLAITSHSGEGHAMSESYCNATWLALNPDNFLVSPQMYNIGSSSTLSFWACAQEANYAAEHFGVAISTTGNTNASDFTTIQEWTLSAKGGDGVPEGDTRSSKNDRGGTWHNYTCDLSAFAGQQVWIAIRHFNCTDKFILCLDDISLKNGGGDLYTMMEGVNVYGGFVGNEPADYDLSSRDIETNLTVLDGQHERTVLRQANDFATLTIWDGFTIANGSNNSFDIVGSGAYLMANSKLQNCVFEHCQSDNWGGAVLAYGAEFVNCVFRNNAALYGGGALYVVDGRIVNCLFANNQASYGGGICVEGEAEFINCDIVNNKSDDYGSGVYSYSDNGTFTNCIIWGNQSDEGLPQVNDKGNYSHCAVEGRMEGEGNIKLSPRNTGDFFCPQFENPSSTAGIDNAADNASWRLSETSICVNRGDNEVIDGYAKDLDGENRIYNDAVVDLGCYESPYEISNLVYPDGIAYVTPDGIGDGTSWDNAMNDIRNVMEALPFSESEPVVWVAAGTYADNDGYKVQNAMTAYPDGTATVGSLPMDGINADLYTRSQYVIPSSNLVQMKDCFINSLTYYTTSNPLQWTSDFQVYLKEVSNSNMNGLSLIDPTTATTVYMGRLSVANGKMTVIFDTPYLYNGGNLLIGMDCLSNNGNFSTCNFQAVSRSYAGKVAYNTSEPTFSSSTNVNYIPTTTFSYSENGLFTMTEGLDVYGGFEGNEPADYDLSLRDFEANKTILDGQNLQRVLHQFNDFTTPTVWDGFTIANGKVEGGKGGGAYLMANTKLQNCVFESCQSYNGGALYADGTELVNCIFRNNTASNGGGAVHVENDGRFVNCLFAYNQAKIGGAIYYYSQSYTESPEFINCDIVNNSVTSDGYGGGIYNYTSYGSYGTYTNCIIWGNKRSSYSDQISGYSIFDYCAVQGGGYSGTGNINLNAANDGTSTSYKYVRFVNPENGDFRLMQNSACVNAGQLDFTPTHLVDLEGNPRIFGDRIDMGCYEFSLVGFHFLGMTNANWNVNTNWLNNSMPSADDEAFIDANCVLNEDVEIWKLTVSNGKSLSVPSGNTLTAETLVTTSPAQLVIEDGGQLVNENNDVKATVRKDINGYGTSENDWYMIASPVTDNTNVTNLTANTYNLFTFDGSEVLEWRTQHDNPAISHKTGYLYGNQEGTTLEFKGTLAGTTDATVLTLADGGEGMEFPGFNMIGNPYPCNAYITDSYLRMNALGNGFLPGTGAIAPCESVFVDAANDGQTVTFSKTPTRISFVSLTVAKNRGIADDRVIVRFDDSRNLEKFMFNESNTKLFIPQNDKEFAVVSAAENSKQDEVTEIPVSFKASEKGTYTISFDMEDVSAEYIHLIDNLTGADVDLLAAYANLKNSASYTFEAKPSDYASRFKLVFKVSNDDSTDSTSWFAYISNGNLVIENIEGQATMQIIDVLGRVLNTEIVSGSYNKAHGLRAGLYIISLNGKTQKIVVE